ncbi:polyprenyl synthetase [Carbonactinospora thermoautotrophica]|uniref:Polyprenyl synthetase n=1 Tax=Carbonactinospora thermoautotrophica TaxID=1469144 RepID=A0A132MR44_9ACTN|nr:polyprenyl synthetase family protein [Carbonactinospora thermoautotrophica]KWX00301.1 polyprenyl synthetase [Carbonactinospora thermoautotrophica]KWX09927.1 polyprenyl synthetase [Carbonactinospora thermoautotrophica]
MRSSPPPRSPLEDADLRARVNKALEAFLDVQTGVLAGVGDALAPVAHALRDFLLDGGKRLRPAFCYWGWRGAGGADCDEIVVAATSLELLQACALIHDDLMDGSDTRRGLPSIHRRFEALHREQGWTGSAEGFGAAAAILLGDMCLSWSDEMFAGSGLPEAAIRQAKPLFDLMRTEVMAGQYLDVLEQAMAGESVERARRVIRFKSAKYTIERPLHVGAKLAGAGEDLLRAYSAYGLPLGEAFQLRDDLLGVFGDPGETGKPAGDDLREGKRTVLIAMTLERATPAQAEVVRSLLGDPGLDADGVARLRQVIEETGAVAEVETMIQQLTDEALGALEASAVTAPAKRVLADLAVAATRRRG